MKKETYDFMKGHELVALNINGKTLTHIVYVMQYDLHDIGYVSFINTPNESLFRFDEPRLWNAAIKSQHTPVFLYQITFMGKTKGALGIRETFSETSIGQDEEQAILNLYGMFDHITVQRVERI